MKASRAKDFCRISGIFFIMPVSHRYRLQGICYDAHVASEGPVTDRVHTTAFAAVGGDATLVGEVCCGTSPGVVICHPHPLYGGSMDSAVVLSLFQALKHAGYAVLRFNFRGVGGSTGRHGGGEAEVRDVLGAIEHLKDRCDCEAVVLAGYSFGAAVALKALGESGAVRFVAVALPTEMGAEIYGRTPVEVAQPSLVAAGDGDEICRIEGVGQIARFRHPPVKLVLRGCDHFFSNLESLNNLCDNVVRFIGGG